MTDDANHAIYGIDPLPDKIKIENFGDVLKTLRRQEGFTSTDLSNHSKVSQSYISQLENNVRLPSDKVISQLAAALAVSNTFHSYGGISLEIRTEHYKDLLQKSKKARKAKLNSDLVHQAVVDSDNKELFHLSEDEKEIVERIRSLNIRKRKDLIKYLNYLVHNND